MKNRYLYNTNYVIWDNLGLQKEDGTFRPTRSWRM